METRNAIYLSILAGFTTNLGLFFTFFGKKRVEEVITISLSFAMGVMSLISIKELIPEPLMYLSDNYSWTVLLFIIILCPLLALLIIKISKLNIKKGNNLYKVGILNMLTLLLHNIPEGIVVFTSSMANKALGFKIALSIAAHNLPEGICIAVPIYYSTNSRKKALFYTFISGFAEPMGALATYLFLRPFISVFFLNIVLYFVGCLMLIISIDEILPEVLHYHNKWCILVGLSLSLFILFL